LLIALPIIPLLVTALGIDRFGVLSIVWVTIGYFSLFDLGIGRSLTKKISDLIGGNIEKDVPTWSTAGLVLLIALGVVAGFLVFIIAPLIVNRLLSIPDELKGEALSAFYLVAFALPFVLGSNAFTGVLQAYQQFRQIALVRASLGTFMLITPLAVLPFHDSLVSVVATLLAGRVIAWFVLLHYYKAVLVVSSASLRPTSRHAIELLRFGGWLALTNIVGPIMVYFDRFFVASLSGMQAVTYYTIPHDLLTKLGLLAGTYMSVIFPALATANWGDHEQSRRIFLSGIWFCGLTVVPGTAVLTLLAPELLSIWVDREFSANSAVAAQLIATGVSINALARTPLTFVQASGRPDWSAKVHLLELPFYLLGLWWMIKLFGIEGAALSWLVRVAIDAWIFLFLAARLMPSVTRVLTMIGTLGVFAIVGVGILSLSFGHLFIVRLAAALIILLLTAIVLARIARKHFRDRREHHGSDVLI
jgi:O-antigen/teichoic acid export membrane protein